MTIILAALVALAMAGAAGAAQCGNGPGGFEAWKREFAAEARQKGVSATAVSALMGTSYATATIAADRGMRSFRLSLDEFLAKRGGAAIVARGRTLKQSQAALFASIEQRYGVPPGPLLAIWGMETAFGSQRGNQNLLSAIATLAYDCRRPEFFTDQLYATLTLIDRGVLSAGTRGAMHGEVGHTQFMPKSILNYGVGNLDTASRRAELDGEFPQGAWLARGRRLPAGRAEFRRHQGMERRLGLSAGDRAARTADRRPVRDRESGCAGFLLAQGTWVRLHSDLMSGTGDFSSSRSNISPFGHQMRVRGPAIAQVTSFGAMVLTGPRQSVPGLRPFFTAVGSANAEVHASTNAAATSRRRMRYLRAPYMVRRRPRHQWAGEHYRPVGRGHIDAARAGGRRDARPHCDPGHPVDCLKKPRSTVATVGPFL